MDRKHPLKMLTIKPMRAAAKLFPVFEGVITASKLPSLAISAILNVAMDMLPLIMGNEVHGRIGVRSVLQKALARKEYHRVAVQKGAMKESLRKLGMALVVSRPSCSLRRAVLHQFVARYVIRTARVQRSGSHWLRGLLAHVGMTMRIIPGMQHRASASHRTASMPMTVAMPKPAAKSAGAQVSVLAASQVTIQSDGCASRSAPISAPRMLSTTAVRSTAPMNIALGVPMPLGGLLEKLLSPGLPDGEELFSLADITDPRLGEELMSLIVKQLKSGPASLEKGKILAQVNAILPEEFDHLDNEMWHALLQKTLLVAIRQIKVFDARGVRKMDAILADAASLLDLSVALFAEWETHFGIHAIGENLIDPTSESSCGKKSVDDDLVRMIRQHLVARASGAFESGNYGDVLLYSFETRIQWAAVQHSAIPDADLKLEQTTAYLVDLGSRNRIAVGRMLTLLVRHSALSRNRTPKKNPLVPQWQAEELRQLIKNVMDEVPSAVSDDCFREQLTDWEKKALNNLIYKANYGDIMSRLNRMGGERPIEEYIDAIAEADESGRVLLDIVLKMLDNHEKNNLD